MASTSSSFQKKSKSKIISIPGTKPSIHNAQLLISTGIPSFDSILGGGLPVGSILLIEEDNYDVYSKVFMKFYMAEGLLHDHIVHLATPDDPLQIINDLPAPCKEANATEEVTEEKMKIAWRYQNKKFQDIESKALFDLTKSMDIVDLKEKGLITCWDNSFIYKSHNDKLIEFQDSIYWNLLCDIDKKIKEHDLVPSPSKLKSNVLRIAIHSLVSPLWGNAFSKDGSSHEWNLITKFLMLLKSIVRSSFSVALITIPSHLFSDPSLISRFQTIVDFVVRLESFQSSNKEKNPLFNEYHGLFHIKKLAAINTLVSHQLDSFDWGFRMKRKTISIKRIHLPPELSETANRDQENDTASPCAGGKLPQKLEF